MRTPRKTVTALVVSIGPVVGTGIVAATAILDLRVPGFTAQNARPRRWGTHRHVRSHPSDRDPRRRALLDPRR